MYMYWKFRQHIKTCWGLGSSSSSTVVAPEPIHKNTDDISSVISTQRLLKFWPEKALRNPRVGERDFLRMPQVKIIAKNFMDMVASLPAVKLDKFYANAFICEAILRSQFFLGTAKYALFIGLWSFVVIYTYAIITLKLLNLLYRTTQI